MSKCLTVVALALLVLTGAVGLRNLAAAHAATLSGSNHSAPSVWMSGIGPFPNPGGSGGGHIGPFPNPGGSGGGHIGPFPNPGGSGGGHIGPFPNPGGSGGGH